VVIASIYHNENDLESQCNQPCHTSSDVVCYQPINSAISRTLSFLFGNRATKSTAIHSQTSKLNPHFCHPKHNMSGYERDKGKGREDYYYYDTKDKLLSYDDIDKKYSTKAVMSKHMGNSDVYPHRNASFDDHGNAQITRSNTGYGETYGQWEKDQPKREKVSKENYDNFNKTLPKYKVEPRDWRYYEGSDKHEKAAELGRDHSVTRWSVTNTIKRYPSDSKDSKH